MSNPNRLYSERWIINNYNGMAVVVNYCLTNTPNAWGARMRTYKFEAGRISSHYLILNRGCFHYFPCSYVNLPPGLTWHRFKTLANGDVVYIIIKIDPNSITPIQNRG